VTLANLAISFVPVVGIDIDAGGDVPAFPVCGDANPDRGTTIVPLFTGTEDWRDGSGHLRGAVACSLYLWYSIGTTNDEIQGHAGTRQSRRNHFQRR